MIWNEILCLGDSITYGARDRYGRSYPAELSKILTKETNETYVCHNHGISGETSSDLLRRTWSACKSHSNSKIALLMIGTNDTQKDIPINIFEDNIRQIISMCKIHGMHVIMGTLPKLGFTPLYFKNSKKIDQYNFAILKIANEMNLDVCNMEDTEAHYIDNVHYTHEGYKLLAQKWASKILNSQT